MAEPVILTSQLAGVPLLHRGKVRDIYDLGDRLLIIATDRISAFDVVLATGIPGKGRLLTALSLFWFGLTRDVIPNHLITADVAAYPDPLPAQAGVLAGRSMLVRRAEVVPVECVVRGYLAGSAWKEYRERGEVSGHALPPGLLESAALPEPIFTPSTKATTGHDENITEAQAAEMVGADRFAELKGASRALYRHAAEYARRRGIIIADTKFEFGLREGRLLLVDEIFTPDSSRFWAVDTYEPGRSQDSFDKQYVRDYLETLDWNKQPPAPGLPPDVVTRTQEKYQEAYDRLAGGR
jgi:phosphoribosylaminoimidazole-succinocarboxamide synthase